MSLGPIMTDIEGIELNAEDRELLLHPLIGGVILFSRNFESVEQLQKLTTEIHALRDPHLLISVDHEGGRVQRFRDGFTALPAAAHFGEIYDKDHTRARFVTENAGWLMAAELRAVGVDFSFAPVLDINYKVSDVIGDRAFHSDPVIISELTHLYIKGMQAAGMAATAKHFPGHGAVKSDSHTDIAVDEREYNDIYANDILPFKRLIHHGLAAIMPAHVIYPKVDASPAGFSSFWLKQILRTRLNFQGIIFSDDLNMEGASFISEHYAQRAEAALHAGCDIALICNNRPAAISIIDELGEINDPVGHLRLARMHGKNHYTMEELHHMPRWRSTSELLLRYQDNPSFELDFT